MMGGGDAQNDPLLPLPLLPADVDDASAVGDDSIMSALSNDHTVVSKPISFTFNIFFFVHLTVKKRGGKGHQESPK